MAFFKQKALSSITLFAFLLARFSIPQVRADLIPRGPTVCLHCPALPGLTLTEDDEPAGYIDCLSVRCHLFFDMTLNFDF